MAKVPITQAECRILFNNLRTEFREVFREVTSGDEESWPDAEKEFRKVFEMTRYALDVVDVPRSDDPEVFRAFCEDSEGMEPIDHTLVDRFAETCRQIADYEALSVECRRTVPQTIAGHFDAYVEQRRRDFESLEASGDIPTNNPEDSLLVTREPPLRDVFDTVQLLGERLEAIQAKLTAVNKVI